MWEADNTGKAPEIARAQADASQWEVYGNFTLTCICTTRGQGSCKDETTQSWSGATGEGAGAGAFSDCGTIIGKFHSVRREVWLIWKVRYGDSGSSGPRGSRARLPTPNWGQDNEGRSTRTGL